MKKIMLILAVCVALTACKKEELAKGTSFKKGQKVTFTVSNGCDSNDKCVGDAFGGEFQFYWIAVDEDDIHYVDSILVTVNGKSSIFTLKSGSESGVGTFEGIMPEDGTEFAIQHPVNDPNLSEQGFNEGSTFNMMKFTAQHCTLDNISQLQMEYGIVAIPVTMDDTDDTTYVNEATLTIDGKSYHADGFSYGSNPLWSKGSSQVTHYFVVEPFDIKDMTITIGNNINHKYVTKTATGQSCAKGKMLKMGVFDLSH